jgi:hypothetical protein
MEVKTFNFIVYAWMACGILLLPILLKIPAPYGRHSRPGWGFTVPAHWGWFVMEIPALAVFASFFLAGSNRQSVATWLFFSLWLLHYTNRTLLFPFRIRTQNKRMPALIILMGFGFNIANGFLNGYYFGFLAPYYPLDWFLDLRFILGAPLFLFGTGVNWWSDTLLIRLKNSDQKRYSIPYGGLFRYVSCPNYFGEIVEWGGFALMVWSFPALSFFVWTVVNLIPRALDHHCWYTEQFEDYPERRRALIPFLL